MMTAASVEKLRIKFPGEDRLLFRDLTVYFKKGEKVLLLGPSGCGKSTLIQALSGIIPNSIELPIKFDHIHVPDSWGFVFQDPDSQFCMPYTDEEIAFVLENLQVPRKEMPNKINKLLNTVGLNLADDHTNIQTLSGGMKQRLAIASVLALDPEVLFLDEPTALLDLEGTKQIWDTVKSISNDKTVIIVEHKIDHILDFIDRVIIMNPEGEIFADGKPEHIFSLFEKELCQYGVWYPGVWDSFRIKSPRIFKDEDQISSQNEIVLKDFNGYRKKKRWITAEQCEARSGDWVAVVGKNGAGKSTFLLSLMQLLKTTGTYLLNNMPVTHFKDVQDKAYFVFQNPEYQFITNSVFDEITYSLRLKKEDPKTIQKRGEDILASFGLSHKKRHHPYQLSVGQKRRLSVATAFVEQPRLLLLDEPTFGQDAQNTFKLLELLEKERQKGTIIIMVTHDLNIVHQFATKVWEVAGKKIIEYEQESRGLYACNH
jgi:energy-coupling factor transport system ATP-binding protein